MRPAATSILDSPDSLRRYVSTLWYKEKIMQCTRFSMGTAFLVALALVQGVTMQAQQNPQAQPGIQQSQAFEKQVTKTLTINYLLYLPKEYGKEADKKWPVMVFLHGSGERGSDLEKLKTHGPP